jgi:epoxide hydrolase
MDSTRTSRREFFLASIASAMALSSLRASPQSASGERIIPFSFRASDGDLMDLKRRLDQSRWPERETGVGWEQGPPLAALREIIDYWRRGYDWRKCEMELSSWPQFRTQLDGLAIHFIHVRSRHEKALPIILTHGWPARSFYSDT